MRLRPIRPRHTGGRMSEERKRVSMYKMALIIFCIYVLLFTLSLGWPTDPTAVPAAPTPLITTGGRGAITVVITELGDAASTPAASQTSSRLLSALRRREWCTSASPVSTVSLVMVFQSAPASSVSWPGSIPVMRVLSRDDNVDPYDVWKVELSKLRSDGDSDEVPCVTDAHVLFAKRPIRNSSDSHGISPAMVRAALRAVPRTDYFVHLADFVVPVSNNFMERLLMPLQRNDGRVLAVQCTLMMKSVDDKHKVSDRGGEISRAKYVVADKGAFVGLGILRTEELLLPYISRRHNGIFDDDERAMDVEVVDAVSPFCTLFRRDAFDAAGGFHSVAPGGRNSASAAPDVAGWDLSIRLQQTYTTWQLLSSDALCVVGEEIPAPQSVLSSLKRPVFSAVDQWGERRFDALQTLQNRRFAVLHKERGLQATANKPLAPLIFFSSDYRCSCCGLMRELLGYLRPLVERYGVSHVFGEKSAICSSAVGAELATIQLTRDSYVEKLFRPLPKSSLWRQAYRRRFKILVMHRRAYSYRKARRALKNKMDYFIGRSLSELSRIPRNWVSGMMEDTDEVWATGEFFAAVYRRAGVAADKIHVVPEALNVQAYSPQKCRPLSFPLPFPLTYTNRPGLSPNELGQRFRFLSVMKWEWRKGWDVLLKAYWKAFGPSSPLHNSVSLYLKTSWLRRYSGNVTDDNIEHFIEGWSRKHLLGFTSMQDFPHIVFLRGGEYMSEDKLRQMYCAADAFVLSTRGEGWGLPTMEAMGMGVPVITTNWGGTTAFMSPNATFAIPVDGLAEVPDGLGYFVMQGSKWALPSVKGLADIMQYVVEHPDHARIVGMRGRRHIEEHFSEDTVADVFDLRFASIVKVL